MKQFIFYFIFAVGFIFNLAAQPKREIRGVWITVNYALDWPKHPLHSRADIERQKEDLDRMLDKLKNAGINMVFIQTRLRGNVIYPSKIEPTNEYFDKKYASLKYDPLAYAINACRQRGMECHAWMVVYPVGSAVRKKRRRGQKTTRSILAIPDRYKEMAKSFKGALYLDPGHPKTTDYLVGLVKEVVAEYDIDGIHFDYVRYPDSAGQFPDADTYRRYGNGEDKADWRRENINRFVYEAYDAVKSLKPWVQVSSSVIAMYDKIPGVERRHWTALHSVYQDPADWIQKGKHDFIVPMMYYADDFFFPFVDDWMARCNERFVVPGLGLYQMEANEFGWKPEVLLEQIRYSRDRQTHGNVFFRARHLLENRKGIYDEISSGFYSTPAILPALTWLSGSFPETPKQIYARKNRNSLLLEWDKVPTDTGNIVFYNIYRSEIFPVDIENPRNLAAVRLENNFCELPISTGSEETGYYYVVTSYDRYHNESAASEPVYFVGETVDK
ncbi:MAG: family 10 glycosylhydrolase [Dysgonamonadaceae bacterium]|jgi:uncharacterized lipoprotein YddW (UPF0748 family)|nr:family 10 glycosylhydrolase [Dysgonamonadaceae bacterium]